MIIPAKGTHTPAENGSLNHTEFRMDGLSKNRNKNGELNAFLKPRDTKKRVLKWDTGEFISSYTPPLTLLSPAPLVVSTSND